MPTSGPLFASRYNLDELLPACLHHCPVGWGKGQWFRTGVGEVGSGRILGGEADHLVQVRVQLGPLVKRQGRIREGKRAGRGGDKILLIFTIVMLFNLERGNSEPSVLIQLSISTRFNAACNSLVWIPNKILAHRQVYVF